MIAEAQKSTLVQLYPNPAGMGKNSRLIISGLDQSKVSVALLNQTGQVINTWKPAVVNQQINMEIPVDGLTAGTYFLQIIGNDGQLIESTRLQVIK
jgi:hypothetical protein